MMKALVLDAPGAPFRLREVPRPTPQAGQVLIRIHASGVNPLDVKIREGAAAHARQTLPAILGLDLAGVVEELGPGVERFRRGDEVYGMAGGVGGVPGSLAEYAAVDAALLARKPRNLSMVEAAALPLIVITAWEGLIDRGNVRPGETVLVQGGAGGVGHAAIQIAHAKGARVFATYRGDRAAFVASLGATPIDAAIAVEDQVTRHTAGRGFDLVYDTIGGAALDASFAAVRRHGQVVSCLGWGSHSLAPLSFKGATYSGVFTLLPLLTGEGRDRHGEILAAATELVEARQLVPNVDPRRFALETIADAHAAIAERTARGKIVISIV